jgi:hypothetical protein
MFSSLRLLPFLLASLPFAIGGGGVDSGHLPGLV